jgi:hypothetical protein
VSLCVFRAPLQPTRISNEAGSSVKYTAFLDTFSDSFLRYGGNLNYPVTDTSHKAAVGIASPFKDLQQ